MSATFCSTSVSQVRVEPLPSDHPLRSEPRALLTPHLGYVTEETYRGFYAGTVAAIEAWLGGKPVGMIT